MMRITPVLPLLFVVTAGLAACDHNIDGIARANAIPFGGASQANLAAMVANPADLIRGRGQTSADGKTADAPIERRWTDHDKALLNPGSNAAGGAAGG